MTWDQFLALCLGLVATVLVRIIDRYLPTADTTTTTSPPSGEATTEGMTP
jgi:hypothetical protein